MKQVRLVGTVARGAVAYIDDEDADLAERSWHLNQHGYAARTLHIHKGINHYGSRALFLHRLVAERAFGPISWEDGIIVDHINRDRLDNQRSNLRLVSRQDNPKNATRYKSNKTGYTGVFYEPDRDAYRSYISCDGQRIQIGRFEDAAEAAWMRDQWAIVLHGKYAVLNFDYM